MEIFRALGSLTESPSPELQRIADLLGLGTLPGPEDHAELFLFQLYPYASIYLGGEGMLGGEARDRIAGFWRALEGDPPAEPDHLAALLALYAAIGDRERQAGTESEGLRWRHARKALLFEHLLSWLPVFLTKLSEVAPPSYRGWADLARGVLQEASRELGPCEVLPLHLREAPPLADPRHAGGGELLSGLLTPVRSGLVLTRDDLARLARDLGVAHRAGERRFALAALVGQDAPAVLSWIADEAGRWAGRHAASDLAPRPIADFWAGRARGSREMLISLASESRHAALPG